RAYVQQGLVASKPEGVEVVTPDCFAEFEELPFESQSLDMIVLPHVLEFSEDPHQLLREVERVLMPEGRVVITGFNPMSLWGLRHAALKRWAPV
ncbi:class I SAM-dependent methyltransferase, partial [Klebsiella pneumoniae]|nr:class I SAM-dependent methyltransferase [Klebsiella pneumoniae]